MGRHCTLIGCIDVAMFDGITALPADVVTALTIRVCRNNECISATVPRLPSGPDVGVRCDVEGSLSTYCVVVMNPDGRYRIDLGIREWDGLRNEDRYELRVVHTPTNTVIAEAGSTVAYSTWMPNGPHCESTCRMATYAVTRHEIPVGMSSMRDAAVD